MYAMRIAESPMDFDDYYRDQRFKQKKARVGNWQDRCGDNIYFRDNNGDMVQAFSFHHLSEDEIKKDISRPRVFISNHFFYFGEKAPLIPEEFTCILRIGKWPQGCGPYHRGESVRKFVEWLERTYRPGLLGHPRDRQEEIGAAPGTRCTSAVADPSTTTCKLR